MQGPGPTDDAVRTLACPIPNFIAIGIAIAISKIKIIYVRIKISSQIKSKILKKLKHSPYKLSKRIYLTSISGKLLFFAKVLVFFKELC